jgi:intracellular sulfur oxidation DsrE/DsrF family protein
MIRRTALASLCAAAFLLAAPLPAAAADPAGKARVVLQVSDPDPAKWNLALNNAKNLQNDLGVANTEIEIVAYGPGIGMLKADATTANRVIDAMGTGIKVVACENTMTNQKMKREDMIDKISYVKAGVVELMQRQREGWAYIRP